MRITKHQLRQIIQKELLQEGISTSVYVKRLYAALGEDNQKIFMSLCPQQQLEFAKSWIRDGAPGNILSD